MEQEGFAYFDWNVDSGDADGNTKPKDYILSHVKSGLCQGRGNVVLMHDAGMKTTTADALPEILQYGLCERLYFPPHHEGHRPRPPRDLELTPPGEFRLLFR